MANNVTVNSAAINEAETIPSAEKTLNQTVLQSATSAYIELFEIDCSIIGQGIYYLTNGSGNANFGLTIDSSPQQYYMFPVEIVGVETNSDGAPPRPTLNIGNLRGLNGELLKLFGSLAFLYEDLVGVSVTYIRTFEIYLNKNTRVSAPPLKYYISKKLSHNRLGLSFELRSPLDKERAFLPKRQMLKRDFPGLSVNKNVR